MKTLKTIGLLLLVVMVVRNLDKWDEEEPPIVNQPKEEPKKVETVYYEPEHPKINYKEEDVHPVQWLYPTGQMHGVYLVGSAQEREYTKFINNQIRKRYKPTYTLEPVEQ